MRTRVTVCPNSKCHKKIEEPILLTTPAEHYYACPRCFIKLNTYTNVPAQEEHMDTTVEECFQDLVFSRAHARSALDIIAPNHRFRQP